MSQPRTYSRSVEVFENSPEIFDRLALENDRELVGRTFRFIHPRREVEHARKNRRVVNQKELVNLS
jgi:hypothetical protein